MSKHPNHIAGVQLRFAYSIFTPGRHKNDVMIAQMTPYIQCAITKSRAGDSDGCISILERLLKIMSKGEEL